VKPPFPKSKINKKGGEEKKGWRFGVEMREGKDVLRGEDKVALWRHNSGSKRVVANWNTVLHLTRREGEGKCGKGKEG